MCGAFNCAIISVFIEFCILACAGTFLLAIFFIVYVGSAFLFFLFYFFNYTIS